MKNKKMPLIALAVLAIVGIVGGTIAYFSNQVVFPNIFHTKTYNAELTEQFKSPEDWTPGTETEKIVEVTNTGNIDLAVRVKYEEEWIAADTKTKPLVVIPGTEERTVNIHRSELANWTSDPDEGGWYYYKTGLTNGGSVRFMDSVTFNENVEIEYTEVITGLYKANDTDEGVSIEVEYDDATKRYVPAKTEDADKITGKNLVSVKKAYTSSNTGYAGATYTLIVTIQTVQLDKYDEAWGVSNTLIDRTPANLINQTYAQRFPTGA